MIPKKRSKKKVSLWAVTLLGLIIGSFYLYTYHPTVYAYRYIFAYNNKDFEKVYSFYKEDMLKNKFSKKQILKVLEEQSNNHHKISPKELTMIQDQQTKKWFVKFPYSLQSIYVFTPTGATVYVDKQKIVEGVKGKGIEVKGILPGKHEVKIGYDHEMYPDFVTEIDVPKETQVKSPYDTHNIIVIAPEGAWIKIGDITKESLGENVQFENMLPGQYELSMLMGDKDIEVFSQNTQIDNKSTTIHLDNVKGNKKVREDLQTFFLTLNRAYKAGIMDKDAGFLNKFLTETPNEKVISDFKLWYMDDKDIKDAKSLMEIREIYPLSGNELKASVLETVYLVNHQNNQKGDPIDQHYRVIIEWDYKLLRENASWQIMSRAIGQSIVAYKEEDGRWITY